MEGLGHKIDALVGGTQVINDPHRPFPPLMVLTEHHPVNFPPGQWMDDLSTCPSVAWLVSGWRAV